MKKLVLGILAHVDAGKTTLSEAMLYTCGSIRNLGRVDHKNTSLDNHELEKARGITIFSKQAQLRTDKMELCLLDTPSAACRCSMQRCSSYRVPTAFRRTPKRCGDFYKSTAFR